MAAKRSTAGTSRRVVRESAPRYQGLPAFWKASSNPQRDTPLLLDTHVWLWTLDGTAGALNASVTRLVEQAARNRVLHVSDFSFWEAAMLVAKGRLELAADASTWLERAADAPGIVTVPVTRSVLVQSTRLPGSPEGDPADRILIAHAQAIGASLLTCDRGIIDYARKTPGIPVCDARS